MHENVHSVLQQSSALKIGNYIRWACCFLKCDGLFEPMILFPAPAVADKRTKQFFFDE